jgi:serine protease AprX
MQPPAKPELKSFLISSPVRDAMNQQPPGHAQPIPVIISVAQVDTGPEQGVSRSKRLVKDFLDSKGYHSDAVRESDFYIFVSLLPTDILELAEMRESVHRIWMDQKIYSHLLESVDTLKASASWRTFDARGKGISWAVLDTGIRSDHPHFQGVLNVDLSKNFSNAPTLEDKNGHGSHVAGIISGCAKPKADGTRFKAATYLEEQDDPDIIELNGYPSGVAPLASLINIKVLDDDGTGSASNAILALEYLRKLNQNSHSIKIDGANLSLGYPFDPKWYGCGHSPLCDEVDRAVTSGIIVVISCGNAGYGTTKLDTGEQIPTWIESSISDPANAESAIAVGSVHKSKPHSYGVSYFSSKGPTGDGRRKPDVVAPGEKVISCSIQLESGYEYEERSGTSMAAPHVSGAVAAFLSAHPEYRGSVRTVKEIFLKTATDLGREVAFQGAGLVDIMRAILSV